MKNLLLGTVAMFLAVGCTKQDIVPIQSIEEKEAFTYLKENIEVKNNMLAFKDEATYKAAIHYLVDLEKAEKDYAKHWDQAIGFQSLNQQKNEKELEKAGIHDPIFAELLNSEHKLQIGDKIFQVNLGAKRLIVTNALSKSMEVYPTDYSYFDIIKAGGLAKLKGACSKSKVEYSPSNNSNIESKVAYQRGGIYFSLIAKIKRTNGNAAIYLSAGSGNHYTKNKNNASQQTIGTKNVGGSSSSYSYRPYFNTRQLKGYYYKVGFSFSEGLSNGSWYLYISC